MGHDLRNMLLILAAAAVVMAICIFLPHFL